MTTSPPLTEHGSSAPDGHPGTPPPASGRRYDLDWLRICAFGILILYHVGLFYVTWDSHVKSRYHSTLLEPLLGMVNSLALLFFVSGVAVRFTIDKAPLGKFLMERSTRLFVFALCGLLAGLGGLILAGNLASADPNLGMGYELDVIAAVILGGTALSGGRGSILGVVIGALLMALLNNAFVLLGISAYWQVVTKGLVIIFAVGLDGLQRGGDDD